MKITREFLEAEIDNMEKQRAHAHEVAVACQAAIDVMKGLIARLDLPEDPSDGEAT
jgi:uncharacterized protein YutE (UPF0331/DUF86 family)